MEVSEYITISKDLTVGFAAIFTACIAWRGLNKWQKELKGN